LATREVFSADELAQLRGFPEPARAELIRHFTLVMRVLLNGHGNPGLYRHM
jgi:hypothetical protein